MYKTKCLGLVIASLVATAGVARADTTFAAGSLIIPATSNYQDDCGAVAMYGLVYNVLRANAWLQANGYGKIELYYAYSTTKKSPNRCTPTNLDAGPAYGASSFTGAGSWTAKPSPTSADPIWNDGCDFHVPLVTDTSVPPVKALKSGSEDSAAADITVVTKSGSTKVYPQYTTKNVTAGSVTEVRYGGGSFVIDSTDATTFRKLLKGSLTANDKADGTGNAISFTNFRYTGTCSFGSTTGGFVNVHSAQRSFQAPTPKVFTAPPPRLALLARNANQNPPEGGTGTSSGTNSYTGRVDDLILQNYLNDAGLNFTGAKGCPSDGYWKNNTSICPVGSGYGGVSGQIYDVVDFRDLYSGVLSSVPGRYQMLWAPHWEDKASTQNSFESAALSNIASFLNGTGGLMAECASIKYFEGQNSGAKTTAATQFQTCPGSGTTCSGGTTQYGININLSGVPTSTMRNCTDPNVSNGTACSFFSNPGDSFAQTGDYRWDPGSSGSHVHDFSNGAGNIYRPSVLPLVSGVQSNDQAKGVSPAAARGMIKAEYATRGYKDDDSNKANILYIGGHDLSTSVAGTKMILQTLLQLGDTVTPTVTKEVTRSSPVVATISGAPAVVQGSFESVTPAPAAPTIANGGTVTDSFQFPAVVGHMRAVAVTNVGSATDFSGLSDIFDAAENIPVNNNTCTEFTSTCRTVFTNLVGGFNPPRVFVKTANQATVGPLMAADLAAAEQSKLIQRTLAGVGSSTFSSKLGGVDRSTVAVVEQSLVAGTSRPTIAYFGATDGMLHAVCASTGGSLCTTLGTEIWAFLPRTQLPLVRSNATRIDGSPRVIDMFGDFTGSGARTFKTILLFQTGSGDPTSTTIQPATYALDITDPANPNILWEYDTAGKGLTIGAGKVSAAGALKLAAFVETNNGDTTAGSVLHAINIETGTDLWSRVTFAYPNPPRGSGTPVPTTGIPGGAVAVDRVGAGFLTDVVYGTLYGDMWQLDAGTGTNKYAGNPLFRFSSNYKPFGSPPAIYSNGGSLLAVMVSGGYADTQAASAQWTTSSQMAVAVSLGSTGNLTETSGAPGVPWTYTLTNEKGFGQALVIGNQIFFTTDTSDVNDAAFGTAGSQTGHAYKFDIGSSSPTVAVIQGGAGSLVNNGTSVISGSSDKMEAVSSLTAASTTGPSVVTAANMATRRLWLQTL